MVHVCSYPTYDDGGGLETVEMYEEYASECAACHQYAIKSIDIELGEDIEGHDLPF